ncbi:Phosphodiesterase family protein [Halorhabdus tiamatea SARL4B]|uniref:Phosphoesterase n=1 Tax=Halorhabdus tiamatea SARL4B TaxID=1033806 RepID=F7PK90_9EURY|nr:metallophosphoesterase family protein [Halorhabdus tiamatea]ERJ07624.1 Phosphodiesterase family protein [Halorhabdus tiamatea SARL4B]CCQ33424.1 phosphodiesterase, MJ0936 family protein [Halorhabdus tiamatea SARL4B]
MDVAIISDSHVPSREPAIPDWALERVRTADHVIHAGDFDSSAALADVRAAASRLTAVAGNMDPRALGLPDVETVSLGGVEFVVTHGTGSRHNYEQRVAGIVAEEGSEGPTVGVAGHTHECLDTTVDGVRLLNPGSVTGASPASEATMLTATASDGDLSVTVHRESEIA